MQDSTYYLRVVSNLTRTATLSADKVHRLLDLRNIDELPASTALVGTMSENFRLVVQGSLKGLDPDFATAIRQIYGALVTKLEGVYAVFTLSLRARNPYLDMQCIMREGQVRVEQILDEALASSVEATNKVLAS